MVRLLALLLLLAGPGLAQEMTLTLIPKPRQAAIVAGEMVPLTIRAVYDLKIANEHLEIAPSEAFDWLQIAPDDWHEERIGGLPRLVMERRLALFPRRAGVLHFGPVTHHLTVIDRESRRQEMAVVGQPVEISVGAFPRERGWKMAAHGVTLKDELSTDPSRLADGETVTRRVTLRALGALPEMLPPRPVVSENWLITFAAPVERRLILTAEGPVAEAVWTWQFRPETGEPGVLEEVVIPYFDTDAREMRSVSIPPLPIAYASFAESRVEAGDFGMRDRLAGLAAGGAGLAAGLGLLAWRRAPEGAGAALARWGRRWSPRRRWRIRRLARSGELLALRAEVEDLLGPAGRAAAPAGPPPDGGGLPPYEDGPSPSPQGDRGGSPAAAPADPRARLDRAIYARDPGPFDAAGFRRALRRALRRPEL